MSDRLPRPPGPRGFAGVAALRRLLADPAPSLDLLAERYGPVVALGQGPMRIAIVGGPREVAELLAMPVDQFRWDHRLNVLHFVVGSTSLLVSDGDEHRRRRRAVMPGFGTRRLDAWIPRIIRLVDTTVDEITAAVPAGLDGAEATTVDLTPHCRDLAIRVITDTMLGSSLAPRAREIGELFARPQAYLESPAYRQLPHRLPWTRRARVRQDRRDLDAIIDTEIATLRRTPTADRSDVLSEMVADGTLTDQEIRDQVVTLIGAGFDTTSAALAWTLWRAAGHPGLWQRLRAEADEVLGPLGGDEVAGREHLNRLELAGRTVWESLRLHPAGLGGVREAAVDVDLGGHRIPARTVVLWSAYLAGRDPEVWPRPLEFDPDRMLAMSPEQEAVARAAWVPFGGGTRMCIGFALAQMELTLSLARLAQRLDLTPGYKGIPSPAGMVVNRPRGGIPMSVAPARTGAIDAPGR